MDREPDGAHDDVRADAKPSCICTVVPARSCDADAARVSWPQIQTLEEAVMQQGAHAAIRGVVAVGVDGSAGALEALRWASAEARLRDAPLRLVHAWTFGYPGAEGWGYGYPYVGGAVDAFPRVGISDVRQAAEELLDQALAEVVPEPAGLKIERQVVEGSSVEVLVGAVAEGDLLVVGSRGRGGFAGLLLGSVSQQCAHHAPCPVVIVRRVGSSGAMR
jgi:nucleotide-binding universal stress UspA family protein